MCACRAGGQSLTPQSQRHRSLPREATPARTPTAPNLGRESGRRLRLAQERMAAAVQAAEAERSETYSGRSTEDTEVRSEPCHRCWYSRGSSTGYKCVVTSGGISLEWDEMLKERLQTHVIMRAQVPY